MITALVMAAAALWGTLQILECFLAAHTLQQHSATLVTVTRGKAAQQAEQLTSKY